jgi:hypothetical protein
MIDGVTHSQPPALIRKLQPPLSESRRYSEFKLRVGFRKLSSYRNEALPAAT